MLKDVREKKGLSQSQLAKESGINNRMIQYYEQGASDINNAKFETVFRLAQALGCSCEEVVDIERIKENIKKDRSS